VWWGFCGGVVVFFCVAVVFLLWRGDVFAVV